METKSKKTQRVCSHISPVKAELPLQITQRYLADYKTGRLRRRVFHQRGLNHMRKIGTRRSLLRSLLRSQLRRKVGMVDGRVFHQCYSRRVSARVRKKKKRQGMERRRVEREAAHVVRLLIEPK